MSFGPFLCTIVMYADFQILGTTHSISDLINNIRRGIERDLEHLAVNISGILSGSAELFRLREFKSTYFYSVDFNVSYISHIIFI